jgi:hypothetical protein
MNHGAILRVSEAIQRRLRDSLTAAGLPNTVYVGALDDNDAANADLVLFLYRLYPVADLRNAEHRLPGPTPTDPVQVIEGSLALTLCYLLTARPHGANAQADLRALEILGRAMQALNDSPEFSGTDVDGETVRVTLDPVSNEEMSRIWTLFPAANYRSSAAYIATPVWIDPAQPRPAAALVDQAERRFGARLS